MPNAQCAREGCRSRATGKRTFCSALCRELHIELLVLEAYLRANADYAGPSKNQMWTALVEASDLVSSVRSMRVSMSRRLRRSGRLPKGEPMTMDREALLAEDLAARGYPPENRALDRPVSDEN